MNEGSIMHGALKIDDKHTRAIAQEIGQRLQTCLTVGTELPPTIKMQLLRLRDLDGRSPSLVPEAEPVVENARTGDEEGGRDQSRSDWPRRPGNGPSK